MVTLLYTVIIVLALFVIGDILTNFLSDNRDRYKQEPAEDPYTKDDGGCTGSADKIVATDEDEKENKTGDENITEESDNTNDKEDPADSTDDQIRIEEDKEIKDQNNTKNDDGNEQIEQQLSAVAPQELLSSPNDGKPDNLTKIKGIGVKIEEKLNKIGVWHFWQIATWTDENLEWADNELSFKGRAKRDDWVGQAKLLAEGIETEFSKRVESGEVSTSKKS